MRFQTLTDGVGVTDIRPSAGAQGVFRFHDPLARPDRSGTFVVLSSVIISSIVRACDAIGDVMSRRQASDSAFRFYSDRANDWDLFRRV